MIVLRGPFSEWSVPAATGIAVGVFDGVHRGHRHVLELLDQETSGGGLLSTVLTFDPHPLRLLAPDRAPRHLTSIEERIELLDGLGVEIVAVLEFTTSVRDMSPEAFVDDILVERLRAGLVVAGEDFRFGAKRTGDIALLELMGPRSGFRTLATPLLGEGATFSSTRIRETLADGDVALAAELLDRPHAVRGRIIGTDVVEGVVVSEVAVDLTVAMPSAGTYVARTSGGVVAASVADDRIVVESRLELADSRVEFLDVLVGEYDSAADRLHAVETTPL